VTIDTSTIDAASSTSTRIHPSVIIDPSAKIASNVIIGAYAIIGPNVVVGADCRIESHACVHRDTILGQGNHIYSYASVGSDPQDLTYDGSLTRLEIGDHNIIREYVSINRGSPKERLTKVGNNNCILAYSHIAHDCHVGNGIRFVNNATLAGHVRVDDHAIIGAFTAVHQFCRIGSYSFLSRATQVTKDVPPYMIIEGFPGYPHGLNLVGLRRHGFGRDAINGLKKAYRYLFMQGLPLKEAMEKLRALVLDCPEAQLIVDFIESSERGIQRKESR
jgi:UDP-N-acetylglucosamine acyltransferase